ncbi:MAG: FecR family protein [candidate division KSB1 bacterium]|jgi:hypothetical protein|nr:FecR family protein [candidate division KSB1 bacterium]
MRYDIKTVLFILLAISIFHSELIGDNDKDIAIMLKSKGSVRVRRANPKKWENGTRGSRLHSGDIIKTGEDGLAAIMFTDDKSLMKVRDNSSLAIRGERKKATISKRVKFALGQFWVKVNKQKTDLYVETPSGIAAVKGTEFYGMVSSDSTVIFGIEGLISFKNKFGEILIEAGETGVADRLNAPVIVDTEQFRVQRWADDDGSEKMLEIEFKNSEGDIKSLKLNYEEQ